MSSEFDIYQSFCFLFENLNTSNLCEINDKFIENYELIKHFGGIIKINEFKNKIKSILNENVDNELNYKIFDDLNKISETFTEKEDIVKVALLSNYFMKTQDNNLDYEKIKEAMELILKK